ncbi:aldose 1-epimerase [Rhodobacteraceae bacterium CCMM004]|nr:aldose 1-epimerase [Rhodobacteraceae bacterium CCMM004]
MTEVLTLEDGRTRLRLVPALGGGAADAEALTADGPRPLLRPWTGEDSAFAIGCNLLTPFANRIDHGFDFEGRHHPVPRTVDGDPWPLHGDGWLAAWQVAEAGPTAARLVHEGAIGPFAYRAVAEWRLEEGRIALTLTQTNLGPRMPFGGGVHPWFPRGPDTALRFGAQAVVTGPEGTLPKTAAPLSDRAPWDFRRLRALPAGAIDNAFTGWDGHAEIRQESLTATLTAPLTVLHIYSPGVDAEFFCAEPVGHPVDAHNLPGLPGLNILDNGASAVLSMALDWR